MPVWEMGCEKTHGLWSSGVGQVAQVLPPWHVQTFPKDGQSSK